MPKHDYAQFFPHAKIRDVQRTAIEFIIDAYESGKRYVIAELGTGLGKSAIALTIARYLEAYDDRVIDDLGHLVTGAYVLTTQKVLQQQYLDDFGPGVGPTKNLMFSIKSANNYKCCFYQDQSCAESRRIISQLGNKIAGSEFAKHCGKGGCCQYALDKKTFLESPIALTNFSYFLAETVYGRQLTPRRLLVVDEAHCIESELSKFTEVTFSEKFAKDVLNVKLLLVRDHEQSQVFDWVCNAYKTQLQKHIAKLQKVIRSKVNESAAGFGEASKQYELLSKHLSKVDRFIDAYSDGNWVMNTLTVPSGKRMIRKFEFKPINVSRYGHEAFGNKVLMLSATIVDKDIFCDSIGLPTSDVAYINIPSPFPVENRPVHFIPAGSMSMKNIDVTLPVMAEAVKMILEQHPNEKGMIHAVSYKVAQFIAAHVNSPRLLLHDALNREQVLQHHIAGSDPTVLLSPSMMEGINLADDASRFQILCKVPFPYLGDAVIKKRMESNRSWYTYQTAKSIIQALGRSIRNENDYAVSYILDLDWRRFYDSNKRLFPEEFRRTLSNH